MALKSCLRVAKFFAVAALFHVGASQAAMSDIYGNPSELNHHVGKGKWLVVKVWRSDCGICMSTMHETNSARDTIPNTEIVGVSLDGDARVANQALRRVRVNFKNLVSNANEFNRYIKRSTRRNITGYPTYMIYAPNGKLKAMQTGDVKPSELRRYISRQTAL
ncbi:TlpA family protein disulfide reductase [Leucothrix pacifica]|uniref:Thioredoxin domain-containing protein n=1 Tax=Leucothrix pacifica TaxID=1247513 RepID=A0A317C297_9GAMM|nr:redoxin domain-containing protein [Leucothrix pacifica]PWQ92786.1 hypothetical protein DKW60_19450 [Leucothrix pacifica]